MRLTTLNMLKSKFAAKLTELDLSKEDIENMIAGIESLDYNDPELIDPETGVNTSQENVPEEYRDELVAWLREEYL